MTGFGAAEAPLGSGRVRIEVRSLNHRFIEVRVGVPEELSALAFHLEKLARQRFKRGRYDITARFAGGNKPPPELDVERARESFKALGRLRDELSPEAPLPLTLLTAVPELFRSPAILDSDQARDALNSALNDALARLEQMRQREGDSLAADMSTHLARARDLRAAIIEDRPAVIETHRQRLRDRIEQLAAETSCELDAGRLEAEVGLLADKTDINEELARLDSHFAQLAELLAATNAVGRRIDFLLQEVMREANTIGSKCQDARLAQNVVKLKTAVERMRQQAQNIE